MGSKAFDNLREWLSLRDAATELSQAMAQKVSERDLLRLAIDEHLILSVYLPSPVRVRCRPLSGEGGQTNEVTRVIEGLCDVPMIGTSKQQIERDYQRSSGVDIPAAHPTGALAKKDGYLCRLPPYVSHSRVFTRPSSQFPHGSVLCIRRTELDAFLKTTGAIGDSKPANVTEVLERRERTTLLTIIAALAAAANIDVSKATKASQTIEALTIDINARVAARTIEDHLKDIPDALERRNRFAK